MSKKFKQGINDIVDASVTLGVGGAVIQATGQQQIIPNTIGVAGRFMGPLVAAHGSTSVLRMLKKQTKRRKY